MNYKVLPCNSLKASRLITHFFTVSSSEPKIEDRSMIPSGRQYIMFHLSGEIKYKTECTELVCSDNVVLTHLHDFCYSAHFQSGFHALCVSMKPNAVYRLFGKEFQKGSFFIFDSCDFLGHSELQDLNLLLRKQQNTAEQVALLEKYFESKMETFGSDDIVDRFLELMGTFEKERSTKEIARCLCTNQRSLEIKFSAITGITPGKYIRLKRFIRLFKEFTTENYTINDLILKYNYTDYSHLYRDFKKYTGVSLLEINIPSESLYNAYLAASGTPLI